MITIQVILDKWFGFPYANKSKWAGTCLQFKNNFIPFCPFIIFKIAFVLLLKAASTDIV